MNGNDQDEFYKKVGAKIRQARGKNLSQEALASAVGLARSSISNIEKGRQKLLLHTLIDISSALQVQPATLLPHPEKLGPNAMDLLKLDQLPENERAFVASAIGINPNQEGAHGRQEK